MSAETLERIARNKNVARAAARKLNLEQLAKLSEIISEVIESKKDEERLRQEQDAAKARKLEEIRKDLEEAGLSPQDLTVTTKRKRGRPSKKEKATE